MALKFLPKELAGDPERLEYFHSEVRLARQVSHPNVCRVYDIGEVNGQHFLSMEYIDGEDLRSLLRRIGRLPSDKGLEISTQLCAGLAAAHDKDVVHRDLKPANIMIDGRGRVRITDFGLAWKPSAAAKQKAIVGTPAYMAPEQLLAGETSVQSDLYSLGLIFCELFTGKSPHGEGTLGELRQMHQENSAPRPPSEFLKDIDPAVRIVPDWRRDPIPRRTQPAWLRNLLGMVALLAFLTAALLAWRNLRSRRSDWKAIPQRVWVRSAGADWSSTLL